MFGTESELLKLNVIRVEFNPDARPAKRNDGNKEEEQEAWMGHRSDASFD
jgi:hypothetical protein